MYIGSHRVIYRQLPIVVVVCADLIWFITNNDLSLATNLTQLKWRLRPRPPDNGLYACIHREMALADCRIVHGGG